MGYLTEAELATFNDRLIKDLSAEEICGQVFPEAGVRSKFIASLVELHDRDVAFLVGGGTVRAQLGCRTYNMAKDIVPDAEFLTEHQILRLTPQLIDYLKKYPEDRMSRPDLDFFFHGGKIEEIQAVFFRNGFFVSLNQATGDIPVVTVSGSDGSATFIDSQKSWRTTPPWPMLGGLAAAFKTSPIPGFHLDKGHDRLYEAPLEPEGVYISPNPGRFQEVLVRRADDLREIDSLDPHWLAYVGRTLLWSLTVFPDGKPLRTPFPQTQLAICQSVHSLFPLLCDTIDHPEKEIQYRGGIRDLAVALRIIVLSDWQEAAQQEGFPRELADFYSAVSVAWTTGVMDHISHSN